MAEETKEFRFVGVVSSSVSELGESRDVSVNVSVLHSKLSELVVCLFVFGIVNECFFELSFHDLPFGHPLGEHGWIVIYYFKPVVLY